MPKKTDDPALDRAVKVFWVVTVLTTVVTMVLNATWGSDTLPGTENKVVLASIFHRGGSRGSEPGNPLSAGCFVLRTCSIIPCRRGGRAFQGAGAFRVGGGPGWSGGQGKAARRRCQAVAIAAAQRQVASMRRRSWRAPRVMRAGTCRTR